MLETKIDALAKALQPHQLTMDIITIKDIPDEETMQHTIEELYSIALDSFNKYLPYDAIDQRTRDATVILLLKDQEGKAVGYTENERVTLAGVNTNYFSTALLRRSIQGKGLYGPLNEARAELIEADAMITRTQNPIVYREFKKLCHRNGYRIHPNGEHIPKDVIQMAREYSPGIDEKLTVRGVYFGRSLMDDTPQPKGRVEQRIWKGLSIDKGDAVMLIGKR